MIGFLQRLIIKGTRLLIFTKPLRILKKFKNITYTLDRHRVGDFKNRDFILKGNGVSLDNKYIETAENNNIPVYMSLALTMDILKKENI